MNKPMKILVSGGGTGGHIYPALAVAQGVQKHWPEAEVEYVGTADGMEGTIVPPMGIPFRPIVAAGWQGRKVRALGKSLWLTFRGLLQARKILRKSRPDLVVVTGGYVSVPLALAAAMRKVPFLIHEQNALPGLSNRLIAPWAAKIMLTYDEARNFFPKRIRGRCISTGLPVRREIGQVPREVAIENLGLSKEKKTILGVGGSGGAKSINDAMVYLAETWRNHPDVQMIHVCGKRDFQRVLKKCREKGLSTEGQGNYQLHPYMDHMEVPLAAADLCISRAGAAFMAEMTVCGIPGILIPYPYASGDHQRFNAESLVKKGAAIMIDDRDLTGEVLLEKVTPILAQDSLRQKMVVASLQEAKPQALTSIMKEVGKALLRQQ